MSVKQIRSELAQISVESVFYGCHTVTFQPQTQSPSEDRHLVEDWILSNETWKFLGVFDGHGAGHEAVDFVLETLPGMIKTSLASALDASGAISKSTIEEILVQCISGIDDRIKADFVNFFPGGPAQISELTNDEIKNVIRDPETGNSYRQVMRARTGTTALIALIDPFKSVHVASLGDCEALLSIRNGIGGWDIKTLSKHHNAKNQVEADRVREEHPNEAKCTLQNRTLGLITLTRAIGDFPFKLPSIYTQRVFSLATPPFHENYKFGEISARNLTPPYISNHAEVDHVDLASLDPNAVPMLILCSDGLCDLYHRRSPTSNIARDVQLWLTAFSPERGQNLALELLWDALGGDDRIEAASKIVRGVPGRRTDDTTVLVLQL